MLIVLSGVVGYLTSHPEIWWFPAAAGMVGQAAQFVSSSSYRAQLRAPGALPAAALSTALLTALCLGAFAGGRWLAT